MITKISSILLASAILVSTFVAANSEAQTQGHSNVSLGVFSRMDTDHDGKVSQAEFQTGHAAQLAHFDTNKDGTVTIAEVNAFFAGHLTQGPGARLAQQRLAALRAADTNGDGVLSASEFKTVGDAEFHGADTNGDGFIDPAEADKAVP